jgi:hypothetical protein
MPTQVTINSISGNDPFSIYICNDPITMCLYIDTITSSSFPYTFNVPVILDGAYFYNLKIVDSNGCILYSQLTTYKEYQDGILFEFMDGLPYEFQ